MQAQNYVFMPELTTHQSLDKDGIPNAAPRLSIKPTKRNIVVPGVLRKGNFKDPLPWNYSVVRGDLYAVGTVLRKHIANQYNGSTSTGPYGGSVPENVFKGYAADPYNKCLTKLYDSVRSSVDLSIDIYQANQTVKMLKSFSLALRSPLKTFAKSMRSIARKGYRPDGRLGISSRWLEWQYGIKPSINTIYEMTNDLVGQLGSNGRFVVKARATERGMGQEYRLYTSNFCSSLFDVLYNHKDSRRCEIALEYGISNAQLNALSQFSSLNPASFIYENIPYSFVLDWFLDVGGYLRNIETACLTGLVFHSGYRTDTRIQKFKAEAKKPKDLNGYRTTPHLEAHLEKIWLNRSILGSMPRPDLPSFKVSLGTERLLSAAALLRQFIQSPKR